MLLSVPDTPSYDPPCLYRRPRCPGLTPAWVLAAADVRRRRGRRARVEEPAAAGRVLAPGQAAGAGKLDAATGSVAGEAQSERGYWCSQLAQQKESSGGRFFVPIN